MSKIKIRGPFIALLVLVFEMVAFDAPAEQSGTGTLSLVANPQVMVYMDGRRVGMTPLLNQSLGVGEHRMAVLLILPNGNRLRADYRVLIAAGQETTASLDLARNAPGEGEVRTIAPAAAPPPQQTQPTKAKQPPQSNSWSSNPGRPSKAPVAVAPPPVKAPAKSPPRPPPPPPEPEVTTGLTREMVREGFEAMRPAVLRCMGVQTGVVQVRLMIQPDGGVSDVETQGNFRGTNAGNCIEQALPEEAAFPIYDGEPFSVVYPYRISPR